MYINLMDILFIKISPILFTFAAVEIFPPKKGQFLTNRVTEPENLKTVPVPRFYLNTVPVPAPVPGHIQYVYTYTYTCTYS
jgi:hypothetical protein